MPGEKPSHRAFIVEDKGEGNDAFWREIAPAWSHRDGKGMDLIIPAGIAITGRIVIREQAERPAEPTTRRAARSEPRR